MKLGFTGREIGACLNTLLSKVIDEEIPNEKESLLKFAQEVTL